LVKRPTDKPVLRGKWVYKTKIDKDGNVDRRKSRYVAQGNRQEYGVNYWETHSPVMRWSTFRLLLAIGATKDWEMNCIDFVTAYLNGKLHEEIYMEQPPGFMCHSGTDDMGNSISGDLVWLLVKALYGLKQAGRAWNITLTETLAKIGFTQLIKDPCVFKLMHADGPVYIGLYVDDMACFTTTMDQYRWLHNKLADEFPITDKGSLTHMLGVRLTRDRPHKTIAIDQEIYIESLLVKHNMFAGRAASTPMETNAVTTLALAQGEYAGSLNQKTGELLYVSTVSRPDIAFAVSTLCKYNSNAKQIHHRAANRVLQYLLKTSKQKLVLGGIDSELKCYTDADLAGDPDDRISTTAYVFTWGGAFSWSSHKQKSQANSTTCSEYYALSATAREMEWVLQLLNELEIKTKLPARIWSDNQGSINIAKNPVSHGKAKHIDIAYHYTRHLVKNGTITVEYCPTESMLADGLTKPLGKPGIQKLRQGCNLRLIDRESVEMSDPMTSDGYVR